MSEQRPSIRENFGRNPRGLGTPSVTQPPRVLTPDVVSVGVWSAVSDRVHKPKSVESELVAGPEDDFIAEHLDFGVWGKIPGAHENDQLYGTADSSNRLTRSLSQILPIMVQYGGNSADSTPFPYILGSLSTFDGTSVLFYGVPTDGKDGQGRKIYNAINLAWMPGDRARKFLDMVKTRDDGLEIPARFFRKLQRGKNFTVVNNHQVPERMMILDEDATTSLKDSLKGDNNLSQRGKIEPFIKTRGGVYAGVTRS